MNVELQNYSITETDLAWLKETAEMCFPSFGLFMKAQKSGCTVARFLQDWP